MPTHAITLHLPESLYERFQQRAKWSRRSVETELLEAVAAAAPVEDELAPEVIEAVESLGALANEELWRLAREAMPLETGRTLETLHFKQREEGLSPAEDRERGRLIKEYERTMLLRAQAAKILKDRGQDVSTLLRSR